MTRRLTAGIVLASCVAGSVHAGAWTMPQGGFYNRFSVNYLVADTEYDEDGEEQPFKIDGEFTNFNLTYYVEYGLRNNLTLFGTLPFTSLRYTNIAETGETAGIADVEFGARVRLFKAPVVLSLQGLAKVPGGYDGDDRLPLGNDQIDSELRLQLGRSLPSGRLYFGAEAGYRSRAEAPSDERRYLLEIGGRLVRALHVRIKYDVIDSVENAANITDVFGNPVATLQAELDRLESTVTYQTSGRWAFEAVYLSTLDGRATAKSQTYSVALVFTP